MRAGVSRRPGRVVSARPGFLLARPIIPQTLAPGDQQPASAHSIRSAGGLVAAWTVTTREDTLEAFTPSA